MDFIISTSGKIIIKEADFEKEVATYFECNDGLLLPILTTKNSEPISYDSRGLFYLEFDNIVSEKNLMLWDGRVSKKISAMETHDMSRENFWDGLSGDIIILSEFFISIHSLAEEPYLLIQQFNSNDSTKIPLKKWKFTEADMGRFGETFDGICYEDGKIINYFFSKKAGMLQTQVIDIKEFTGEDIRNENGNISSIGNDIIREEITDDVSDLADTADDDVPDYDTDNNANDSAEVEADVCDEGIIDDTDDNPPDYDIDNDATEMNEGVNPETEDTSGF
jgi:hypothetical protein